MKIKIVRLKNQLILLIYVQNLNDKLKTLIKNREETWEFHFYTAVFTMSNNISLKDSIEFR